MCDKMLKKGESEMAESNGKANDGAQYVRQQKGHSLVLHILLCFVGVGLFTIPYYTISKNHYWHA